MPKKIEKELMKQASKLHLTGDRKNAYVYGTLNKIEKAMGSKGSHPAVGGRKK